MNVAYNMDCLEGMRTMKDGEFDLAIVDPPYGDALHAENGGGKGWFTKYNQKATAWNRFGERFDKYKPKEIVNGKEKPKIIEWDIAPTEEYFAELFRVSKNQIIWGGNYFDLPPTRCFIVWRKTNIPINGFSMSPVEYAWTSFTRNAVLIEDSSAGGHKNERFHPTQKPVSLYAKLLQMFAQSGDRILDTHLGSGSSRIASWDAGLAFVGYEIDKTYYDLEEKRFADHTAQMNIREWLEVVR